MLTHSILSADFQDPLIFTSSLKALGIATISPTGNRTTEDFTISAHRQSKTADSSVTSSERIPSVPIASKLKVPEAEITITVTLVLALLLIIVLIRIVKR